MEAPGVAPWEFMKKQEHGAVSIVLVILSHPDLMPLETAMGGPGDSLVIRRPEGSGMAKSTRKKRSPARRSSSGNGAARSVWPWLAALVGVGGAIYAHDSGWKIPLTGTDRPTAQNRTVTAAIPRPARPEQKPASPGVAALPAAKPSTQPMPPMAIPVALPASSGGASGEALEGKGYSGKFFLCGNSRKNDCVIDGSTFWHRNTRIRLVDVDIPSLDKPRCDRERNLASDAEQRLWQLLDAGPFDLATWPNHDRDTSGTRLRVVMRSGQSIGDILVKEGLARKKGAPQKPWC